ncbi:MAG: ABC transporter permease [Gemmatimonadaceae bacterium]|nr:ABC transporter permease [Gemmatimonadaceae bacterium]
MREARLSRGAVALVLVAAAAALAPWLAPYDPAAQLDIVRLKNAAPSAAHWLGTDPYARDVLSRAVFGARTSLSVAAIATALATVIGGLWGTCAALAGDRLGDGLMSVVDVVRSLPRMLLFLGVAVLLGPLGTVTLALVLGATAWTGTSRLVYVLVREISARPFVEAARSIGASRWRLLQRHVLPQLVQPMAASGALLLADILAVESSLSFIGLGVRPPAASWGGMLQDGLPYLRSAWWLTAVPSALLVATVLGAAAVADRLERRRAL